MRKQFFARVLPIVVCILMRMAVAQAATPSSSSKPPAVKPGVVLKVCDRCIRAHEEFLASDALQGRGSATHDELMAATYAASQLRQYGIDPAGDGGGYIQHVPAMQRKFSSAPQLRITPAGSTQPINWDYGKEFSVIFLTQTEFSGPLRKLDADQFSDQTHPRVDPGAVVLLTGSEESKVRQAAFAVVAGGAAATLMLASEDQLNHFEEAGSQLPKLPDRLEKDSGEMNYNLLSLNRGAFRGLQQMAEGAMVNFNGQSSEDKDSSWNTVGILRGTDPSLQHAAILFSAHLDHLGIGVPVNGDDIYNGADDDASGTTAVLEIARVLGRGRRPRRTVIFALFGSEEMDGLGATYFREHPPLPLKDIAANLEFEMIGRPDPAVKDDALWLTGWERSNLGPALAAHGARLVRDPHPGENFFARSDNFVLAKKGVVAQTISSYGLHKDYHQPSDDLAHLDFKHMDAAIGSLLAPLEWLVNSDFQPGWNPGGKP